MWRMPKTFHGLHRSCFKVEDDEKHVSVSRLEIACCKTFTDA